MDKVIIWSESTSQASPSTVSILSRLTDQLTRYSGFDGLCRSRVQFNVFPPFAKRKS